MRRYWDFTKSKALDSGIFASFASFIVGNRNCFASFILPTKFEINNRYIKSKNYTFVIFN